MCFDLESAHKECPLADEDDFVRIVSIGEPTNEGGLALLQDTRTPFRGAEKCA